jgi:Spy/CpxP family protein refolding chaperone
MQRWMRLAGTAGIAVAMVCAASVSYAQNDGPGGGRGRGGRGGGFGFGGGGMGFGGGRDIVSISGNEAVQKDLALSEEQVAKLKELADAFRDARRSATQDLGFGPPGEGEQPSREEMAKRMTAMQEATAKVVEEFKPKLVEIVSAEQLARLEGISLQARGTQALTDKAIAEKLAISDEQKTKLSDAEKDYAAKRGELFGAGFGGGGGGGGGDFREKMQALTKERDDAVMAVLTQEQKDKLAELKGKEFDVSQLGGRGGRGGFGGPGGGPGGGRGGDRPQRPATDDGAEKKSGT